MSKTEATSRRGTRRLLLTYLKAQIDELRAREPGARIDTPDAVHRMRVACRRLRSSLATFRPLFKGSKGQRVRYELQWVGTVLGPVRDVEVMRARLHETAATLAMDADLADVIAELDHELAQRHSHAHQELLTALDGPRYARFMADLEAFVIDPPWAKVAPKEKSRHTLSALVGHACARVDRAAQVAVAAMADVRTGTGSTSKDGVGDVVGAGGAELHEVRKAAKRARYAAEVAGPAVAAAHALVVRMEEVQEVLGSHQDSLMVRALFRDVGSRMTKRQARALGRLTAVEQATDASVVATWRQGLALASTSTDELREWTRG